MESTSGLTANCTRANGSTTKCTERDTSNGLTAKNIRENSLMIKEMVKDILSGQMEENTTVSGTSANNMDTVSTR